MAQLDVNQLKSLLDSAHSVALLLPRNPTYDMVASALGLKLSLEQDGKSVTVAAPDQVMVEFNRLVGVNTITQNFGKRDLIISFPGQTEMVDKVSYNVEKGELQLVITPKANVPGLDPSKLKFVAGGTQTDLVIFIGVQNPSQDLGQIWDEAKEYLQSVKQFTLSDYNLSQTVVQIITHLNLPLNPDAASNLLDGLEKVTNRYQAGTTAETFEVAATLMRHGARRQDVYSPNEEIPGTVPQSQDAQPMQQAQPNEDWYEPKVYKGTSLS